MRTRWRKNIVGQWHWWRISHICGRAVSSGTDFGFQLGSLHVTFIVHHICTRFRLEPNLPRRKCFPSLWVPAYAERICDRQCGNWTGFSPVTSILCRSQWPSCLRRVTAADHTLGLRVRIPPGAWRSVSHKCCVLPGRGPCDGLITRPEESYWLSCVTECDLEKSRKKRPWSAMGCCVRGKELDYLLTFIIPLMSHVHTYPSVKAI